MRFDATYPQAEPGGIAAPARICAGALSDEGPYRNSWDFRPQPADCGRWMLGKWRLAATARTVKFRYYKSSHLILHFAQPVRSLQYLARLASIRRPNNALTLHHVQNAGRAPIP